MYYYILEAPQSRSTRQVYTRLRDTLTNLGISGELVTASPARTPTELAAMGLYKGYTTVVAVGGDAIVNEVATTIMGRAVLGVIPIEATEQVTKLIGVSGVREAAESLKYRRLTTVSTVLIAPETHLFLDGVIKSERLAKVSLVIDSRLKAFAYFNELTINRELDIKIESIHITDTRKVLGLFQVGGETMRSVSQFHAKSVRLVTDPELSIRVANQPIASSPLQLRLVPESLKVITRRGTLA